MTAESPYRFTSGKSYSSLYLMPEFNDSQWSDFERLGDRIVSELHTVKSPAFMVDLTGLNYIGSATVALIVRIWKELDAKDGRMVIVNSSEMIDEVLRLAGLNRVWTIVPSHDEAVEHLCGAGPPNKVLVVFGIIGLLALICGAVAFYAVYNELPVAAGPAGYTATIGCAVFACFAGLWIAVRGKSWWRWAGAAIIVAGGALIGAGIIRFS